MNKKANDILCNFINAIGLDGEYYREFLDAPVYYGNPLFGADGEYLSPESDRLNNEIRRNNLSDDEKRGAILISNDLKDDDLDGLLALIHEKIHSTRTILTNDGYFDYNQDMLHGYARKGDEKEDKMYYQRVIDETLVELMTLLAYKMRNNTIDVYSSMTGLMDVDVDEQIKTMCEIILRHHDLDLFKWMLDPLSYSLGDTDYDFFFKYTENDKDLVGKLIDDDLQIDILESYFKKSI